MVVIGAGWGGLSTAHALSSQDDEELEITVVDASPRVGGLVRDGFETLRGTGREGGGGGGGRRGSTGSGTTTPTSSPSWRDCRTWTSRRS